MNRQAVPSIFLSIATVCFFAVILYQRDPQGRRTAAGDRATSGATRPAEEATAVPRPADGPALAPNRPATAVMPRTAATEGPALGSGPKVIATASPATRELPVSQGR